MRHSGSVDADSGQPVGDPLTADSQSVATLVLSADRRILFIEHQPLPRRNRVGMGLAGSRGLAARSL